MQESAKRIASLDGLRAISIGLVLFGHLSGTQNFPFSKHIGDFFALAEVGVIVFFVISGYLITTLLLRELMAVGNINLVRFYFRRTLRIFPPYYTLILVVLILRWLQIVTISDYDIFHAITYTTNYFSPQGWYLGHTWSLSVEEQFYLLWPATLWLLGKKRAGIIALILLVVCPFVRTLSLFAWFQHSDASAWVRGTDSLACGCVLALWRDRLHAQAGYLEILRSKYFVILPILVFLMSGFHRSSKIYFTVGLTFINLGIAVCVDWCMTWPQSKMGTWLNACVIVFIGVMSYSLYLWQQLFLNRASNAIFTSFPLNLGLAFIAAISSYYLIESPALRWRQRWEQRLFG